jgi:hypothetical protein
MRKGKLTREQAIEIAGIEVVEKLDNENCDFTNRVQCDGDTAVEFSASVHYTDPEFVGENNTTLIAYYYQEEEDLDGIEDLSDLGWEIAGYEVV